jgi:hypothetical protein
MWCIESKCVLYSLSLITLLAGSSCISQKQKDSEIKTDITMAAKESVAFAGVNYMVMDGIVILTGTCATAGDRDKVLQKMEYINRVKDVEDNIRIAPVLLTADLSLKLVGDSVLMRYPTLQCSVQDSVITVYGTTDDKSLKKALAGMAELNAKGVEQKVSIDN